MDADTQPQQETTQQVNSKTPATAPHKDPKTVAAGKALAEKTKQARKEQEKGLKNAIHR